PDSADERVQSVHPIGTARPPVSDHGSRSPCGRCWCPRPLESYLPQGARYAPTINTLEPARWITVARVWTLETSSSCSQTNHGRTLVATSFSSEHEVRRTMTAH